MAAVKETGATRPAFDLPKLPPVTVARIEEAGRLLERIVAENQELFVAKGEAYKAVHRDGTSRPLRADEAAQLAAMMTDGENAVGVAEQLQSSSLRAYDQPDQREVMLAAGVGTAPAFIAAVRKFVALVEMPADEFEQACEDGGAALADAVDERARALRHVGLREARARAKAAMEHYAAEAEVSAGKQWRLLAKTVWQALTQATAHLSGPSGPSSLIDSAAPTAASPATTSSTASAGAEQPS